MYYYVFWKRSAISQQLQRDSMLRHIIDALIITGSALMIVNIIGFIRYAVFVKGRQKWNKGRGILYVPIVLLCLFFPGYVTVWIFGSPDIIMAGILFGGSIFVFIMMLLLNRITKAIIESEQLEASLKAAEESSRLKSAFLATISHEMRTPRLPSRSRSAVPETKSRQNSVPRTRRRMPSHWRADGS